MLIVSILKLMLLFIQFVYVRKTNLTHSWLDRLLVFRLTRDLTLTVISILLFFRTLRFFDDTICDSSALRDFMIRMVLPCAFTFQRQLLVCIVLTIPALLLPLLIRHFLSKRFPSRLVAVVVFAQAV